MGDTFPKLKAAAVQAAPVLLDREATVAKACRLIEEAGCELVLGDGSWRSGIDGDKLLVFVRAAIEFAQPTDHVRRVVCGGRDQLQVTLSLRFVVQRLWALQE